MGPQCCVLQGWLVFSCWDRALCKTLLLVLVLGLCNLLLGTVLCQVRQGGSSIPWSFLAAELWSLGHICSSPRASGLGGQLAMVQFAA